MRSPAANGSWLLLRSRRLFFCCALSACTHMREPKPHSRTAPTSESTKSGPSASSSASLPSPAPAPESPAPAPVGAELRLQPRSALERAEMERPADPELKLELGRRQWCGGARGPAVESWLWVQQFGSTKSPAVLQARSLLASARNDPDALADRLECGDIRDDERN